MKTQWTLAAASLLLSSSLMARPMVAVDVIDESSKVDDIILRIGEFESKQWAIGLDGQTLKADAFLKFFQDRSLDFKFYVQSANGVSTGTPEAYQENITVLKGYKEKILQEEITELERIATELKQYQESAWAVGLDGDSLQPDQFLKYFADHNLPFDIYVQHDFVTIGNASSYDKNIMTLDDYRLKLELALHGQAAPLLPQPAQDVPVLNGQTQR